MKELLFNSLIEKEALENLLALNQIKKCDAEIEKYKNEINEQNEKMMNILKEENIDESYVEKIHKYKNLLNNIDGDNGRIAELSNIIIENENRINDFQTRIIEIENHLEELKKEIFETDDPSKVIECQNEIETQNVRLNDLNDILNGLISDNTPLLIEKEFLIAKNNDFDFNIPNYNKLEINADLNTLIEEFNKEVEKLALPVRENIEFCQKKINNREIEIQKYNDIKNSVIEAYPNSVGLDTCAAYESLATLLSELNLFKNCVCVDEKNIFDETEFDIEEETEEIVIEEKDIKDEMISREEEPVEVTVEEEVTVEPVEEVVIEEPKEEIIVEETPEEVVAENTTDEVVENDEIGSVSYVLSDGESFKNIAEKVYPSEDNWEAIYYFNKETIDKYLVSNGFNSDFETIKELAGDTNLFTGIKLEIPTDYNYKV